MEESTQYYATVAEVLLNSLAEAQAARDLVVSKHATLRDKVLEPLRADLDDLAAEYQPKIDEAEQRVADLTEDLKSAVIKVGGTVSNDRLQAMYTAGRTTWDNAKLTGYAAAHPEINAFCKIGQPSVSIRVRK